MPHFHGGEVEGAVAVAGLDAIDAGPGELAAAVGYVAQDPETQVVSTTVAAEIELPLEMRGDAPADRARAVEEVALALAIPHLLGRAVDTLSGGELQRVALAAALVTRPRLVLLDEPTSQLDPVAGDELIWLLRRLNEEWGVAVLLAEHRLERCLAAADRVVAMDGGADRLRRRPGRVPRLGAGGRPGAGDARRPALLAGRDRAAAGRRPGRAPDARRGRASRRARRASGRRRRPRSPRPTRGSRGAADSPPGAPIFSARGLWVELERGGGAARRPPRHRPRRSAAASGSP